MLRRRVPNKQIYIFLRNFSKKIISDFETINRQLVEICLIEKYRTGTCFEMDLTSFALTYACEKEIENFQKKKTRNNPIFQ